MNPEDVIICRCEDITLADVHRALEEGHTDLETLKRVLRCTMGRCGGRTCRPLLIREIAQFTGQSMEEVSGTIFRPPTTPISLGMLAEAYRDGEMEGDSDD